MSTRSDPSPSAAPAALPLAGRTIALPESRALDLLASMVEKTGAAVRRCPLVSIRDAPDPAPVEAWLRRLIAGEHHDVILLTGEGLRRLIGFARRAGLREQTIQALAAARKITRGPKPVHALREIGLRSDLRADAPTTDGVIASLTRYDLDGHRVGVQLYGQNPNEKLMAFLRDAHATPDPVAPYVYSSAADDHRVLRMIDQLAAGGIDAIAFTSASQVSRLCRVAAKHQRDRPLRDGLTRTLVAAVGPIVADRLRQAGVEPDTMPRRTYFMKPLITEIVAALTPPTNPP